MQSEIQDKRFVDNKNIEFLEFESNSLYFFYLNWFKFKLFRSWQRSEEHLLFVVLTIY